MDTHYFILNGWAAHSRIWQSFARELALAEAVSPDNVHALSWEAESGLLASKERLNNALDQHCTGAHARYVLIGWSLGAVLALDMFPDLLQRPYFLVILSGTGAFASEDSSLGWPQRDIEAMVSHLRQNAQSTLNTFYQRIFTQEERAAGYLIDCNVPELRDPINPLARGLEYLMGTNLNQRLKDVSCPVLWLHGSKDLICPIKGARLAASALPDCRFAALKNTGHAPFITQSAECINEISRFSTQHKEIRNDR